ncbi:MAG: hypothetical protein JO138_03070 [Acidobacteriaceae bacterium]|nr:hypothetical protein [Acidobacteriaceae bacterium]
MRSLKAVLVVLSLGSLAQAHIGSPDIYLDGKAGPYELFVTIRPPAVIPGLAELEIRSESAGVREIHAIPLPMSGPGARFAPVPDLLKVSPQDSHFFTGSLWMMATGSWQVRITVDGAQGRGILAVPVPSAPRTTKKMQFQLGLMLSVLGLFLVGGLVAMSGAAVREARLRPGTIPNAKARRRGRIGMSIAFLIVIGAVWAGNAWWSSEANSYSQNVYKPLQMSASLNGSVLKLNLSDPGWLKPPPGRIPLFTRKMDDLIPDHDHLMHLYMLREPGLDMVYHLHPDLVSTGVFRLHLPTMPAGTYNLYADVVHATGFPETLVTKVNLPEIEGRPLSGDDASGAAEPWSTGPLPSSFRLPDGYTMQWMKPAGQIHAKEPLLLTFKLTQPDGSAPRDMAPYMGMLGHAAFVKTDGTVFAHIHPTGTVSMAAFMLAEKQVTNPSNTSSADVSGMNMPGMDHANTAHAALPNQVSFPYGFPSPGRYRIFVQMKHGQTIETGVFDAELI